MQNVHPTKLLPPPAPILGVSNHAARRATPWRRSPMFFKSKSPVPLIIIAVIVIIIGVVLYLTTGQTEWSASWSFEF